MYVFGLCEALFVWGVEGGNKQIQKDGDKVLACGAAV